MSAVPKSETYRHSELVAFAAGALERIGHAPNRAAIVAEFLVEGDLLGHSTHGLQLLPLYVDATQRGDLAVDGAPVVVIDRGGALTLDGGWLPGPWLLSQVLNIAFDRIRQHPVVTVVIRHAGHIGCLAAYPRLATERGLMMILSCSDPSVAIVAPHGGTQPKYSPNPIAAGWPTDGLPVIIDVCPSSTTNGMVARLARAGKRCPGPWLIDHSGHPSDDPSIITAKPPGAILPLGGPEMGHKGFALGLLVEALTSALGGAGRSDPTSHWGASVFLQIIDPQGFGGRAAFIREAGWTAQACRDSSAIDDANPVRTPGERGVMLREQQLRNGISLNPDTVAAITDCAHNLGIPMPNPVT